MGQVTTLPISAYYTNIHTHTQTHTLGVMQLSRYEKVKVAIIGVKDRTTAAHGSEGEATSKASSLVGLSTQQIRKQQPYRACKCFLSM